MGFVFVTKGNIDANPNLFVQEPHSTPPLKIFIQDLKKQWTWVVPLDSSCGDGNAPATDP
jgi:hypothetical protein